MSSFLHQWPDQELTKLAARLFSYGLKDGRTRSKPRTANEIMALVTTNEDRWRKIDSAKLRQVYGAGFDISAITRKLPTGVRDAFMECRAMSTEEPANKPEPKIGDDLIFGAENIGHELKLRTDQVYYLIRRGRLPIVKLGPKTIVASKKKLRRTFQVES